MAKRVVSWAAALREGDFAAIADWFIRYFFTVGALLLILSGIAVGIDKNLAAGIRVLLLSLAVCGREHGLRMAAWTFVRRA